MDKRTYLVLLLCSALCVAARSTSTAAANQFAAAPRAQATPDRRDSRSQPSIIEQFSRRNPDSSYEYRYELSDGQTRYERGYFVNIDNRRSLVVTGYYGYRMDDGRYTTVFYTADHEGYRQQSATTSQKWENLPRTIDVQSDAAGALGLLRRYDAKATGV